MIHIHPDRVQGAIGGEWRATAAAVSAELLAAADQQTRAEIIENKNHVWRDLKPELSRAGFGKCWYCESRDSRSDNAVDHFRPKRSVAEDTTHEGYWWLSFTLDNFRYSCTFCNSRRIDVDTGSAGGKHDRFPVADEAYRAHAPSDSLDAEQPMLLDPYRVTDVILVWFDDSGETRAHPLLAADSLAARRVESAREIYHLDHSALVARRRRVFYKASRLIEKADAGFLKIGDAEAKGLYEEILREIRSLVVDEAEHALAARCAIRSHAPTSGAAQALLDALQ